MAQPTFTYAIQGCTEDGFSEFGECLGNMPFANRRMADCGEAWQQREAFVPGSTLQGWHYIAALIGCFMLHDCQLHP